MGGVTLLKVPSWKLLGCHRVTPWHPMDGRPIYIAVSFCVLWVVA